MQVYRILAARQRQICSRGRAVGLTVGVLMEDFSVRNLKFNRCIHDSKGGVWDEGTHAIA